MPVDEAMLAEVRQANEPYLASYEQRLAAQIVAMLPEAPDEARRVLAVVDIIMNLPVKPRPSESPRPDASA